MAASQDLSAWIEDGAKYAFVGLEVKLEEGLSPGPIASGLWVIPEAKIQIESHWREWLGTIRSKEIGRCNLLLLTKLRSSTPDVLDAENIQLTGAAWGFYVGLLLASAFAPANRPVMLTGSRRDGVIGIRQQQDFESPTPSVIRPYPPVLASEVQLAARLATSLAALPKAQIPGGQWRFFRTLNIYIQARTTGDLLERIHQFARCIDGLIAPDVGQTKRQFKSRTELFIGPRHHDLMGDIYEARSASEHLNDNRYLERFDRGTRLDLVKKEAIIEYVARTSLARVLGEPTLWPHFVNTSGLDRYWESDPANRRRIWGSPVDPQDALLEFDERYISDADLGARPEPPAV